MIAIFGEENLEDDLLTDMEEPVMGDDAQPPQKRRRKSK
jgi:hypothetical protein